MPIVDGREYRSISVEGFEAKQGDEFIVEGYATTFSDPYEMAPGYFEQVDRAAFDGVDLSDVIFQYDHAGMVMARTRNGSLAIMPDDHGLYVRASLKGTEQGRQLHEAIRNGLVDKMSWGFTVDEGGWDYDAENRTSTIRKIRKVYDVSAVSIPANGGTEIQARSYFDGVIEAEQRESLQRHRGRTLACARLRLSTGLE